MSKQDIVTDQRQFVDETGSLHLNSLTKVKATELNDGKHYLLKSSTTNVDTQKQLLKLAKNIVGDSSESDEKVAKLLSFVSEYIEDSPIISPMTIESILSQRKGDCTEHAQLFTALSRAAGIPTREVSGLIYLGDDVQGFGGHIWNEVVIDNHWVAVDPSWNLQQLGATHIQLSAKSDAKIFNSLGRNSNLSFKIKKIEYKN